MHVVERRVYSQCRILQAKLEALHTGAQLRQAAMNVEYIVKLAAVPYLAAELLEKISTGLLNIIRAEDLVGTQPMESIAALLESSWVRSTSNRSRVC